MDAGRALPREHQSPLSGRLIAVALIVAATAIPAWCHATRRKTALGAGNLSRTQNPRLMAAILRDRP